MKKTGQERGQHESQTEVKSAAGELSKRCPCRQCYLQITWADPKTAVFQLRRPLPLALWNLWDSAVSIRWAGWRFTAGVRSILMPFRSVMSYEFPQRFHINFDLKHKKMKWSLGTPAMRLFSEMEKGGQGAQGPIVLITAPERLGAQSGSLWRWTLRSIV